MAEKVVHIPDDVHEQAKAFCKKNHIHMRDWVSSLIEEGIENVIRFPLNGPQPVKKKDLPKTEGRSSDTEAFEQPPFWGNRKP